MLNSVSFDWNDIITKVWLYTTDKDWVWIDGGKILWDIIPQLPSCQGFDPQEYFDFETYNPLLVDISVAKVENIGVTFHFEDRNKALRRKQKSDILTYTGPTFQNRDLSKPIKMEGIIQLSQTINSENDETKKCKNYPYYDFNSYQDCDEKYLHQLFSTKYRVSQKKCRQYFSNLNV